MQDGAHSSFYHDMQPYDNLWDKCSDHAYLFLAEIDAWGEWADYNEYSDCVEGAWKELYGPPTFGEADRLNGNYDVQGKGCTVRRTLIQFQTVSKNQSGVCHWASRRCGWHHLVFIACVSMRIQIFNSI